MINMRMAASAGAFTVLLILTGCGSDTATSGEPAARAEASAAAPEEQSGGRPGGFDPGQIEAINECLDAAGLDIALPTDLPTALPTDLPTDRPTDLPEDFDPENFDPENMPEGMPSGGPGGGAGFGALQDPEVQEALAACGLDLPQR